MRQIFCAKNLAELGFEVALFGFEKYTQDIGLCTRCDTIEDAAELASVLILPLPVTSDGLTVNAPLSDKCIPLCRVFEQVSENGLVLYGGSCCKAEQLAAEHGVDICNYYEREDYKVANAVPTAEGALALAIDELPVTLYGAEALVIGYGRIGKVLCRLLDAFGATVHASARKSEDLIWAQINGCHAINTGEIADVLGRCDLIFNTVPKTLLKDDLLSLIRKDTLVVDLASKPGGIDFKLAKERGLNVVWALSLPGKTAPVSAGKILSDTVFKIMNEKGVI